MRPLSAVSTYPRPMLAGPSPRQVRFGNDAARQPALPPAENNKGSAAPAPARQGWFSGKWHGCIGGIGSLLSYAWPPNWPIFKKKPASPPVEAKVSPPPVASPGPGPGTQQTVQPAPEPAGDTPSPKAAVESAAEPQPVQPEPPPATGRRKRQKPKEPLTPMGVVKGALRLAMNSALIAGGVFVLLGATVFHMPFAAAVAATIGVQLLQSWVLRYKGEQLDVHDPKKMARLAHSLMGYYDAASDRGLRILKKIPLVRRLEGTYQWASKKTRRFIRNTLFFAAQKVIPAFVSMSTVSPQFWDKGLFGKAAEIAKLVLSSLVGLVCKPLGPFGRYVMNTLNIRDAASIVDNLAPRRRRQPQPPQPPRPPQPPPPPPPPEPNPA